MIHNDNAGQCSGKKGVCSDITVITVSATLRARFTSTFRLNKLRDVGLYNEGDKVVIQYTERDVFAIPDGLGDALENIITDVN